MVPWWSTRNICKSAAAWGHLLFSSLLLQMITSVHGVPSCPQSCSCPGIKEVHCTFRHITTIPKTFPKGTERLNLGYNSLTEVEGSEFKSLRQLEMLMLHGNDISTVHYGAFYSLRSLQILKLSYNKLTSVNPALFQGLVGLVRLHLDNNLISFIEPYSFSGLTSLKLLQLEGNLLKDIHPHTFITLSVLGSFWTSGLKHLHLAGNLIEDFPATAIKTFSRLELLTLHGNPLSCDCQLQWLVEWSATHEGVIKCKKERGSIETCPQCSFPQHMNGTQLIGLTPDKLTCERPVLRSPLKQWDNPKWAETEAEPDLPYTLDLEKPLGQLIIVLSDSHGNQAHVACDVRHPRDGSPMTWAANPHSPVELSVNVSLMTVLECEIDREALQNLWQLVAYYYESPAILERGQQRANTSRVTYKYVQVVSDNSPYFTELKGYLGAEPSWLLQPRITLKLNRQQTTTKKLVLDFTTLITKEINSLRGQDEENYASSWALIRRGRTGQVQAAFEGSRVHLECDVITSASEVKVEWMLPDLSTVENPTNKIEISERGQLIILNATLSDSGLYHCFVRTKAGVGSMPLRLTIKERLLSPTSLNGEKITVQKGNFMSLPCEVTSAQPSQTLWYLPNNQVLLLTQQTRKAEVSSNGTLFVRQMMQEDAGEYSCLASNLYGVDMLSHIVEVIGEETSYMSKVHTPKEQSYLTFDVEEREGSGGGYQQNIRPFATQLPEKVVQLQRKPNGFLTRIKDSKRKPSKSVKELDPNRWAAILAKANSKPGAPLPTVQSLKVPNTVTIQRTTNLQTSKHVTTDATVNTNNHLQYFTTPSCADPTTSSLQENVWDEKKGDHYKVPKISKNHQQIFQHSLPEIKDPSQQHVDGITEKVKGIIDSPEIGVIHPVNELETKHLGKGRTNSNFVPGISNRRRLFHRPRKPLLRRIHPHINPFHHSSNKPQTTITIPTTITTTTTTPTTTTTATTTHTTTKTTIPTTTSSTTSSSSSVSHTTTIPTSTTTDHHEPLSSEYQTAEDYDKYYEEYDYKNSKRLDAAEYLTSETLHNTKLDNSITPVPFFTEINHSIVRQESTIPPPKLKSSPLWRAEDVVNSEILGMETENKREHTVQNGNSNKLQVVENKRKSMTPMEEQEHLTKNQEKNIKQMITQNYNPQSKIQIHNRSNSNAQPVSRQDTPTRIRTSSTKVFSAGRAMEEGVQKWDKAAKESNKKFNPPPVLIMEPLHPWLHHTNQGGRQTTNPRFAYTHQETNTEGLGGMNPSRHFQLPRVPPTSHLSAHHNPHDYSPIYPSWPYPRQDPDPHPATTHQPWSFPHQWAHGSSVTNRPKITADALKPNPTVSGTENFRYVLSNTHHHHQNQYFERQAEQRNHLFLSRLRNGYRQAKLDRIAQLGRIVTHKPLTGYYNLQRLNEPKPTPPTLHRPYILKPPTPTAAYGYLLKNPNLAKPSSSPFSGFIPTPPPYLATISQTPYRGGWPPGEWLSSRHPTPALPFLQQLEVGVGGEKPCITTVSSASMSVLTEDDVFLPCKATGNPQPSIIWTKVSTGATIPASTKHGSRFEVFRNGTFVITNIQLQDRGQYLCTAHNKYGSDRMVVTLTIQTESPKIHAPKSTEVATYLGKNVFLDCLASGKPPAQISWILPDRTFVQEAGTVHTFLSPMSLLKNGTLKIHTANFSSKGEYKCIASNAAGADTVTYRLYVAALPPSISEEAQETVIIQQGRSVYVHCSVKGEPVPALKWMLPAGLYVKPSQFLGHRLFIFPNGTLLANNVLPSESGRYECLATNIVGMAKRTVQLEVKDESFFHQPPPLPVLPPQHHATPSQQHFVSAMYGSTIYLHCPESIGSTTGTLWQLPSKTIVEHRYSPEKPIKVFYNGTLRIFQLTELDSGNYLCSFQRPNGEDMELFQVEVLMTPPRIEHVRTEPTRVIFGENFQVDCVTSGLPNPEIFWSLPDGTLVNNGLQSDDSGLRNRRYVMLGNGTLRLQQISKRDEGDYTCHAKNKLGKDERKIHVKMVPSAPKIGLKSLSLVTVKLRESVKLSCQADGAPKPIITWISPQTDLIPVSSDKYRIMDDGTLVVNEVTLTDEGKYTCVAQNSAGNDIKNIIVEVELQEPCVKGKSATKVLAVSYQTTLLDCRVEGKPEPKIWWITPYGHSLTTSYFGGRFQVHQNGSLQLRGVRKTDEGKYKCLAKNHLGETSLSVELEVASLAEKPSFAFPNIEILPIKQDGVELILECPARGKPNPEFLWVLPNGTVLPPGLRLHRLTHHSHNGTLWISQPVATDKGIYRCLAKNVAGQAEKRYALETGRKPVLKGFTGGMKITYGLNFNLPCTVDGWPEASITWTLPNGVVLDKPQTSGRISFFTNGTLQVKQVATFDKGTYICKASNSFGSTTLSYPVTVMVFPPRITNTMASITRVIRGTPVMLQCVTAGIPKPDVSWTLPGRTTLLPHNRYTARGGIHMAEDGSLVIQNPVLTNSGIYKCNAKNAMGTDFKSTYLQVV